MQDEKVHLVPVAYDQVDVTAGQLQRNALPGIKRQLFYLVLRKRIDMLPQHPESWVYAAKNEVGDLINVATTEGVSVDEVLVCFDGWIYEDGLAVEIGARNWLSLDDPKILAVLARKIKKHVILGEVLIFAI